MTISSREKTLLKSLRVVNDVAERGIKLIEEYNNILTKNEDYRHYILQCVKDYRDKYHLRQTKTAKPETDIHGKLTDKMFLIVI